MKIEVSLSFNDQSLYVSFHQGKIFDDKFEIVFRISTLFSFFRFCVAYNDFRLINVVKQSDFDYDLHWNWIKNAYLKTENN